MDCIVYIIGKPSGDFLLLTAKYRKMRKNTMQFSWLTVLLVLAAMAIYPFRMLCTASGKNCNKVLLKIRNLFQKLHVPKTVATYMAASA